MMPNSSLQPTQPGRRFEVVMPIDSPALRLAVYVTAL